MADLAARHARVAAAVEERVLGVLRSGRYVGGPVVEEAEGRLAAAFGWRRGVGVNSGTDALVYALMSLGVGPGDEVIVPAVTFFATAGAVARVGATPVIADTRADTPLLDAAALPLGPRTRAVIAVHLFGATCELPALPVPIVDDAAQAIGADPPARVGVVGAASFYPTKTLGAAGDAGLVLTDDEGAERDVRLLTHHGMPEPYLHVRVQGHVGANSRMDAVQAAVLLGHLDELPARITRRRQIADRYDAALAGRVAPLPRSPGHPVHHYVVLADDRDALRVHLRARGVETALYYPRSLAAQPALAGGPATPNADRFCAHTLALPAHEGLSDADVERVVDAVLSR